LTPGQTQQRINTLTAGQIKQRMSFKKYIASLPRAEADEVSTPLLLDLSGNPIDITVAPCNGSGLG
jgi:hypothetical protein